VIRRFSLLLALLLAGSTAACSAGPGRQAAAPAPTTARAGSPTSGAESVPSSNAATAATNDMSQPGAGRASAVLSGQLPLWPFASSAEAQRWQRSYRAGGHQPWHLSPDSTALSFARGYLGFTGIDRVTSRVVRRADAWIGVGFLLPNGRTSTAAVVHLLRYGSGATAPWEVVGTRDSTLTLTSPRYGATVSSPIRAGGLITGVDESIAVQVRQSGVESPLGRVCCVAAGGTDSPWLASVRFAGASAPGVLTVVASTGGHVAAVERFAVTGARVAAPRRPAAGPARDGDIDGDGRVDRVSLSAPGVLHVRYASGDTDDVRFRADAGPVGPAVLGAVDADWDGHAEVFVRSASGASTEFASLFRYTGGRLRLVTTDGGQAQLAYFGSAGNQSSWACRPPRTPIVTWTGTTTDGSTYLGTETSYRFDGAALVVTGSRPRTVTPDNPAPSGCGSLRLR
jgi:hypothetical protein